MPNYGLFQRFRSLLNDFRNKLNAEKPRSLVVFIMSHGQDEGKNVSIMCNGGGRINLHEIHETLLCPGLEGRPKMFFYQACRGKSKF